MVFDSVCRKECLKELQYRRTEGVRGTDGGRVTEGEGGKGNGTTKPGRKGATLKKGKRVFGHAGESFLLPKLV